MGTEGNEVNLEKGKRIKKIVIWLAWIVVLIGVVLMLFKWFRSTNTSAAEISLQYFASKEDYKSLNTVNDDKAVKVNLGVVPSGGLGSGSLADGTVIPWWIVGSDGNMANIYSSESLCSSAYGSTSKYSDSTVRRKVKELEGKLFSAEEGALIQESTIRSWYRGLSSTLTEKLYLPSAGTESGDMVIGSKEIYVPQKEDNPSINCTILATRVANNLCWLRSSQPGDGDYAFTSTRDGVGTNGVLGTYGVAPACKINLSSLIFSSAAQSAASIAGEATAKDNGVILAGGTHNMRLAAEDNVDARILRSSDYTTIKADNVKTDGTYYLMVQGTTSGGTNYAYVKQIVDGQVEIKVSDIKVTPVSSFEGAKAWIENSNSDGQVLYANRLTTIDSSAPEIGSGALPLRYFMNKDEYNGLNLLNPEKTIRINLGTVPETIEGADTQPANMSLTAGNPILWWIVGSDGNMANIYSAEALCRAKYRDSNNNQTYSDGWGCTYSGGNPTDVYASHYGGSDVRLNILRSLETKLFSSGREQGLIQPTTIRCWDNKAQRSYTVTDRMYLPSGGTESANMGTGGTNIYVPQLDSDSSVNCTIPTSRVDKDGVWCWLRSPYNYGDYYVLEADRGSGVNYGSVYGSYYGVAPACQINLSSLIFSSAARSAATTAKATGGLNLNTADYAGIHNIRVADEENVSAEFYRNIEYKAVRAENVPKGHYLMVQGITDAGINYAYAKEIDENNEATISVSDIKVTPVSSFEGAKVWIEKESTDGQISYASNLTTVNSTWPIMTLRAEAKLANNLGEENDTIHYGEVATVKSMSITENGSNLTYGWYKATDLNDRSTWTRLNSELSYRCKKEDIGSYLIFQIDTPPNVLYEPYTIAYKNPIDGQGRTINNQSDIDSVKGDIGNGNNGIMVDTSTIGIAEIEVNDVQDLLLASVIVDCGKSDLNIKFNCTELDMTNQNYIPLGDVKNPYKGTITGNNCVINGYKQGVFTGTIDESTKAKLSGINNAYDQYAGLVGNMQGGSISDLTMKDSILEHKNYVGTFVGFGLNCKISNCKADGVKLTARGECVGGIVAAASGTESSVQNCTSSGEASGQNVIGGIVGDGYNTEISGCSSEMSLMGEVNDKIIANNYNCTIS